MSISSFINECENSRDIDLTHLICVSKNEKLFEYVKPPYTMDSLRLFFSMTKSFASLAIGIASDLRMLDIDDFIIDIFKGHINGKILNSNLELIKIRDLLTMSSGIENDTYHELIKSENWITAFLNQEFLHNPGEFYVYSTHSSHMLSAIITEVTNLSLEEFLNKYLFYPMEIYEAQWELSPEGLTAGGMGLSLYPSSLVKVAQMLLNNGVYNGKKLISEEYLKLATTEQIIKQNEKDNIYSGYGYGFQFHIGKDFCYRADGAFGQVCLICPKKELAIIAFSQYSKTEKLLKLIYEHLLNKKSYETKLLNDKAEKNLLCDATNKIKMEYGKYELNENILNIKYLDIGSDNKEHCITLVYNNEIEDKLIINFSSPSYGKIRFLKDLQIHLQQYICYSNCENGIHLRIYLIETPYVIQFQLNFVNDEVIVSFSINVSFTLKNFTVNGRKCLD